MCGAANVIGPGEQRQDIVRLLQTLICDVRRWNLGVMEKITATLALPASERNRKFRRAISRRVDFVVNTVVYSGVGYLLNRSEGKFTLADRPEFQRDFHNFPNYKQLFRGWTAGNRNKNCGDTARFYFLYQNVRHVLDQGVKGDLVELGVHRGNSARVLAELGRAAGRKIYLFDTFKGFDERDLHGIDGTRPKQFADTSVEGVLALVGGEGVTPVKGFFPESLAHVALPEKLAVAHIDCDLHDPMKAGLENFYPRLSPGGLLIMHDYSSGHWPGATRAVDVFFADKPEKPILMPDRSGSAVIRKYC